MTEPGVQTFPFRFERPYRILALPFGITPSKAWVRIGGGSFEARFGPWRLSTSTDNLDAAQVTGPYALPTTAGPAHLSFTDRGLTFASNGVQGVCVSFKEPVPGISPVGGLRHPALTVTVADVEGLCQAVERLT